jgi:hypothetical protein
MYGFSLTRCAGREGAWGPQNGGSVAFLQLKQSLMTCFATVVSCGIHNDSLIFAFVCSAPACSSFVCASLILSVSKGLFLVKRIGYLEI